MNWYFHGMNGFPKTRLPSIPLRLREMRVHLTTARFPSVVRDPHRSWCWGSTAFKNMTRLLLIMCLVSNSSFILSYLIKHYTLLSDKCYCVSPTSRWTTLWLGGDTNGPGVGYDPNTKFTHKVYRKELPKWPQHQLSAHWKYISPQHSVTFQLKSTTRVTPNGVADERHSILLGLMFRAYCTDWHLQISLHWPDGATVWFRYVGGSATETSAALSEIWGCYKRYCWGFTSFGMSRKKK